MKLINEKEVEEAAIQHIFDCIERSEYDRSENSFKVGVDFAEQKLTHLMLEFAEWCAMEGYLLEHDGWRKFTMLAPRFTTEQLLEQFLKTELEKLKV